MWALLVRGLAFLKNIWDWFRNSPGSTYQPPPAGVKERHDPFSALALLFTGGIAGAVNLGAFGEIFRHFFAAVNSWISGTSHPYKGYRDHSPGSRINRHWDYSQPRTGTSSSFFAKMTEEEIKEILDARRRLSQLVDGFEISGLRLTGPEQKRNG